MGQGGEVRRHQAGMMENVINLPRRAFLHLAGGAAALTAVSRITPSYFSNRATSSTWAEYRNWSTGVTRVRR
jgi:hypothetical protein